MTPDAATTTSTPAPQPAAAPSSAAGPAPGPQSAQSAPAPPAPQPTPAQLFWEVARLAFVLMTRLLEVLRPIQSYYLAQSRQAMRVCTELCRVMLTIRFAPERITQTQLRHLTRARHILQALFNYTLPLGPRTSSSATATANQSPSASPLGARTSPSANPTAPQSPLAFTKSATPLGARTPSSATTPSPAVAAVPEVPGVPEVPEVPGVSSPSPPTAVSSPTVDRGHLTPAPSPDSHISHPSHDSHTSQSPHSKGEDPVGLRDPIPHSVAPHSAFRIQHSAFSPYIPDANTLVAAVRAATLPPNCAGALLDDPGEALVRALHELHAVYFSLYPNQPPTPSPSPSPAPSPSQSSGNLQSSICNPQSSNPQSSPINFTDQSTESDGSVRSVGSVGSDCLQSEVSNLKSEIPIPHSEFRIPHSDAPP